MSTVSRLDKKPVILIVCNYYLPGYKAGGGLRTLAHMVERFNDRFDFRVITRDHDGDNIPYTSVRINQWNEVAGAKVYYLSRDKVKISKLRELILTVRPDIIYLNSIFSIFTILLLTLRRMKLLSPCKIILAPEGELSDGALQLKAHKKKAFIVAAKSAGLYQNLIWKAAAEPEKQETERFKGEGGEIFIAPNIPARELSAEYQPQLKPRKEVGAAKMIFLSRYMRKKNFKWLVDNLGKVRGNLEIDIYGPLEDEIYWEETTLSVSKLPANIKVEYKGVLIYEKVIEKLSEYHFFVLPTLGENFGHVFIEALAAGCPLITSNRTPWRDLEKKEIGWDLALEDSEKWLEVINFCINLDDIKYRKLSDNAREFAKGWLSEAAVEADTLKVLQYALSDNRA